MRRATLFMAAALAVFTCGSANADVTLIAGGIGVGNGDFNYEGGATAIPGTRVLTENVPRDRVFAGGGESIGNGQGFSIDGWTVLRQAYSGGNSAFGLDGHFGFDDAAFEASNTGSGQAFINGNSNHIVNFTADQISQSGVAGDVFNLSYLLGSDNTNGTSIVTLTLDSGLGS